MGERLDAVKRDFSYNWKQLTGQPVSVDDLNSVYTKTTPDKVTIEVKDGDDVKEEQRDAAVYFYAMRSGDEGKWRVRQVVETGRNGQQAEYTMIADGLDAQEMIAKLVELENPANPALEDVKAPYNHYLKTAEAVALFSNLEKMVKAEETPSKPAPLYPS